MFGAGLSSSLFGEVLVGLHEFLVLNCCFSGRKIMFKKTDFGNVMMSLFSTNPEETIIQSRNL